MKRMLLKFTSLLTNKLRIRSIPNKLCYCTTSSANGPIDKTVTTSLQSNYSEGQQEDILKTINTADEKTLSLYGITLKFARSIIKHRKTKGEFQNIDQILEVDGFTIPKLQTFYNNVANMYKIEKATNKRLSVPEVSNEIKETISTAISMEFYPYQLSWVHLDRNFTILDWGNTQYQSQPKPFQHGVNLNMARQILSSLPQTHVFLVPKRTFAKPTPKMLNAMIGMCELEAMVLTLIEKDMPEDSTRIFSVKPSVVSSFFSIKVGTEMVSGQAVAKDLILGRHCGDIRKVNVDEALWQWYLRLDPCDKEPLASVLLRAVAFFELEVFKRTF